MSIKLFDSELKIMEILWEHGDMAAGEVAKILKDDTGWNRNTTYTVIKKCIAKGAIERYEPNFMCKAIVKREEVQEAEMNELIDKMFNGSAQLFFAGFLKSRKISKKKMEELKDIIKDLE